MPVKLSLQISVATTANATSPRSRVADWTESYWAANDTVAAAFALLRNGAGAGGEGLLKARARLLPAVAGIVEVTGQAYTVPVDTGPELASGGVEEMDGARTLGNPVLTQPDAPQVSLMFSCGFTGHLKRVRPTLRGTPDNQVVQGEGRFRENGYRALVGAFLDRLSEGFGSVIDNRVAGAAFRGFRLQGIAASGQVVGVRPVTGIAAGAFAKVVRTTREDGTTVSGPFLVSALGPGGEPILDGWDGSVTKGGRIYKWRRTYAAFNRLEMEFVRAITRKVGSRRSYRGVNRRTKRYTG